MVLGIVTCERFLKLEKQSSSILFIPGSMIMDVVLVFPIFFWMDLASMANKDGDWAKPSFILRLRTGYVFPFF